MPHDVDHNAILDQLAEMRGGVRNVFEQIDPRRTVHLVVDMQNGFVAEGAPVEVTAARGIIDQINAISAAMRAAGGTNIFLRYTTPKDWDTAWTVFWERMGVASAAHREAFTPGNRYHDLWPQIDFGEGDLLVDKDRFSAFTGGTSELPQILRDLDIDTVIITGTLTNCCCECAARDAMQHNYRVIMAADANAALSDTDHAATLHTLGMIFADLRSADELVAMLQESKQLV